MLPIKCYINKPSLIVQGLLMKCNFLFSDKIYLKLLYRLKLGRKLDLKSPKRYTEKLQWLKLYDRKPLYTRLVDKYEVKEYVANIIGNQYIIPTLGLWDDPKDIDWNRLPNRFILKTTHSGGGSGIVICREKSTLDKKKAMDKLNRSMNQDIYATLREWPFKGVRHRVIAEQLLDEDPLYRDVPDYKFYCFNGEPKVLLIATNRFTDHNFDFFDMDFRKLNITSTAGRNATVAFSKPACFDEMRRIASMLSRGFIHLRVDLYYSNNKIYFGELTFYDLSGFGNMSSDTIDMEWGSWIKLSQKEKME